MSLRSLLAAGVEAMARGTIARALGDTLRELTVAARMALGDRLFSRLRETERGDRAFVQTLIDQQYRAVRAARQLERNSFVDARSVPITLSGQLDPSGNRFQVLVAVSFRDPTTGQIHRDLWTTGFNETIYFNELWRRVQDDAERIALMRSTSPPVPIGAGIQILDIDVLSITRSR